MTCNVTPRSPFMIAKVRSVYKTIPVLPHAPCEPEFCRKLGLSGLRIKIGSLGGQLMPLSWTISTSLPVRNRGCADREKTILLQRALTTRTD
ncbi:hypothetical protein BV898_04185 [Hypsibius exemplaris]|uniref:Uncharacterized protein n=1 Tax=Hypsibius exemplaris TaxID=2072580 RepID=A0A1W0X3T6_HYPEX|nr:hypothetical protein BV898_04185 [Hypsibius exemplaris]